MKKFMGIFAVIVVIVALAMLHLYIFTRSIRLKYEVADLRARFQKIYRSNRLLRSVVAERESLDRIEKIAKAEGRMYYPEEVTYIMITEEAR